MANGIDVSHHQGSIDFSEVSKNDPDIYFCFIKATQGVGYVDPQLKHNASEANKYGIKVGYYHYATLNSTDITTDAKAEADFFVDTINTCVAPDLPLVLDIEENKANLTKDKVRQWIKVFFDQLTQRGYGNHILYSYTPFLNANLPANHDLGNKLLWIAAYVNKPKPTLPKGWSEYYIWQYSAKGKVKGISGDCDLNKFK